MLSLLFMLSLFIQADFVARREVNKDQDHDQL